MSDYHENFLQVTLLQENSILADIWPRIFKLPPVIERQRYPTEISTKELSPSIIAQHIADERSH